MNKATKISKAETAQKLAEELEKQKEAEKKLEKELLEKETIINQLKAKVDNLEPHEVAVLALVKFVDENKGSFQGKSVFYKSILESHSI